jgi:hypothetical protein
MGFAGQRKIESIPLPCYCLGPDAPPVAADDIAGNGQAHAGAFKLPGAVQALENAEQLPRIRHIEARTVILYKINDFIIFCRGAYGNNRLVCFGGLFNGVGLHMHLLHAGPGEGQQSFDKPSHPLGIIG